MAVGNDTLLYPIAQELLTCLCNALEANATEEFPAPAICCLRAGEAAIQDMDEFQDECCQGMAYVRIDGFYATGGSTSPFPSPSSDFALSKCAPFAWGLQMEMGVFRCMSTGILDCPDWETVALRQMNDAKAMRAAVCCFMRTRDQGDVALGSWTPKGREGGCIGGIMPVTAMVINKCAGC